MTGGPADRRAAVAQAADRLHGTAAVKVRGTTPLKAANAPTAAAAVRRRVVSRRVAAVAAEDEGAADEAQGILEARKRLASATGPRDHLSTAASDTATSLH